MCSLFKFLVTFDRNYQHDLQHGSQVELGIIYVKDNNKSTRAVSTSTHLTDYPTDPTTIENLRIRVACVFVNSLNSSPRLPTIPPISWWHPIH